MVFSPLLQVKFIFVAPDVVKMKDDIKDWMTERGIHWEEATDLSEVAPRCNVLYQTRIQKERFLDNPEDYDQAKGKYVIDPTLMTLVPADAIVLHPLPRVDEITPECDTDPRAAYFRQATNGLYIRMALLKILILGRDGAS